MFSKNLWFLVGLELLIANDLKPEKTADISWCHCLFPPKMSLPRSDKCHVTSQCVISMECLRSFLRHHFMGKPVVASWNVNSFLRLHFHFLCFIFIILHHLLFTEPRQEWFETHSSLNFNKWFFVVVYISRQLSHPCFFLRAAEDVELWFSEVENLLAVEDLGKVCYRLSLEPTHV